MRCWQQGAEPQQVCEGASLLCSTDAAEQTDGSDPKGSFSCRLCSSETTRVNHETADSRWSFHGGSLCLFSAFLCYTVIKTFNTADW